MDLMQLIAAHNTAALRFAFIASIEAEKDATSAEDLDAYNRASTNEREAFAAVVEHVPASSYDLNIKARYLLGRIAMGEPFPPDLTKALLRSIVQLQH